MPLRLSGLTFALLATLATARWRNRGVIRMEDLMDEVWAGKIVTEDTITQRVKLLRQALNDSGNDSRYIESVRGIGYRLIPEVRAVYQTPKTLHRTWKKWLVALLVLAGLAVLVITTLDTEKPETAATESPSAKTGALHTSSTPTPHAMLQRAWKHLDQHQAQDQQLAVALFTEVLEQDGQNLSAKAGLSLAIAQGVTKFGAPLSDLQQAKSLAQAALQQAPDMAQAHLALGASLDAGGALEPAIAAYERALLLDPEQSSVRASMAYLLQVNGQLARALQRNVALIQDTDRLHYLDIQIGKILLLLEWDVSAIDWLRRAHTLKPANPFTAITLAESLMSLKKDAAAEEVLNRARLFQVQRPEIDYLLGWLHWQHQQLEKARKAFTRAALDSVRPHTDSAVKLAVLQQDRDAAQQLQITIRQALQQGDTWPSNHLMLAELHMVLDDTEKAVAALQAAVQAGYRNWRLLQRNPVFETLHDNHHYQQVVAEIQSRVAQEKAIVLAAPWLPEQIRSAIVQPVSDTP